MRKNAMFRGCTRPAMFLGVPVVPFFVGVGTVLLIMVWSRNYFLITLIPVVIMVMRAMAKRDEMIFRLLGLKLQFRMRTRNIPGNGGMWVYSPNDLRKNPPR
ncbi:MAG: VirB3 family type IV secretion system protein [Stenotrophomonas sp.]